MAKKYLLLITLILTFSYLSSYSQDIKKQENMMISPGNDTLLIEPVPLSEITTSLELANEKVKKTESKLAPGADLVRFDSVFKNYSDKLITKKEKVQSQENYYTLRKIDDATREWTNYYDDIKKWKELINDRLRTLENDLFEIEFLEAKWNLTIKNAKAGGVPADVLTTATDFTRYLLLVKKECSLRITEALGKQNKISEVSLIIDDVLSFLESKRKEVQSEYLVQDSPPIWRAKDSTGTYANIKSQIIESVKQDRLDLSQFVEDNRRTVVLHVLIFIVLWLLYYLLHIQSRKIDPEKHIEEFHNARTIISHYGISALIVSLFLTIWIYPSMFNIISDIVQLAFIIIAIIYLPKFFDDKLRLILIGILILYIVNDVQLFFYSHTFFVRFMQIAENILAGYILYVMIKPGSFIAAELKRKNWKIILKVIPIFFILLAGSLLGNIFGFVDLSVLLGNAVVNSLFNLIILILAIMVVNRTIAILLRTPLLQSSFVIRNHIHDIERRSFQIIKIAGILLWLKSILKLLGFYTILYEWFIEAIDTSWPIGSSGTATIDLGNIISFILVIISTILVFRFVNIVLKEDVFPRVVLPRGIPGTISTLVTYLIIGYGTFIAIGAAGVDLGQFGLIAGALGVGIGFGLQGIVANFIAGLVLAFERPIQVGDEIQMATTMGVVRSIGVRSTVIRTYDGSEVIIPNGDLITKEVVNWTLSDRKKRRDILIGVAYGTNPETVLELIRRVANDNPDVLKIPAPWALFDGFGDSSLNFRLRIWTTMDNGITVRSNVTVKIYEALEEAGIEIPFPQRDLHIKSIEGQLGNKPQSAVKTAAKKRQAKSRKPKEEKPFGDETKP